MSPIPFEPGALRMLAKLMHETGLGEIELAEKDRRIRMVRAIAPGPVQHVGVPLALTASVPVAAIAPPHQDSRAPLAGAVLSPMIGVVYLAPEPGAAAFISVGARVEAGQTLLLIEAMKTFNPITAPSGGTVTRILVNSEDAVETGEALVVIE